MHFLLFLVFTFFAFVIAQPPGTDFAFTNIKIVYTLLSKVDYRHFLDNNKNEVVVSLGMFEKNEQAVLFTDYYQKLNKLVGLYTISKCLTQQTKSNVGRDNGFKLMEEILPELIFKYQEFLHSNMNKKNSYELNRNIKTFNAFIEIKLKTIDEKIEDIKPYTKLFNCFKKYESQGLERSIPEFKKKLKNLILMMVIESSKPWLISKFPNLVPETESKQPKFKFFESDIFYVFQGLKISDIYFRRHASPHQSLEKNFEQSLVFPIDIVTNPKSLKVSNQFFRNFLINTGLQRLTERLRKRASRALTLSFISLRGSVVAYVQDLYEKLKKVPEDTQSIQLSTLKLNGIRYRDMINSEFDRIRRNVGFSFGPKKNVLSLESKVGSNFRQNIVLMVMLIELFCRIERLPSDTNPFLSSLIEALPSLAVGKHTATAHDHFTQTQSTPTTEDTSITYNIDASASKGTNFEKNVDAVTKTPKSIGKREHQDTRSLSALKRPRYQSI